MNTVKAPGQKLQRFEVELQLFCFFGLGQMLIWTEAQLWKWKWSLGRVQLFETPWTVAYQASPATGFSRQEDWSTVVPTVKMKRKLHLSELLWLLITIHAKGLGWGLGLSRHIKIIAINVVNISCPKYG